MKIVFATMACMQNWKTMLTHFIIIPIFNIILLIFINAQFTNHINFSVAYATVVVSGGLIAMSSIVDSLITDLQLRIDREVIAKNPFCIRYWGNKILASFIMAIMLIMINLLLILYIKNNYFDYLFRALLISPIVILSGINIGITAFILSWRMNNPYFFANFFATFTFIISVALVSCNQYPIWLKIFCELFPYSNSIDYILNSSSNWWIDIIIDIIWFLITVCIYNIQLNKLK